MAGRKSKNLDKYVPKWGQILRESDFSVFYKLDNNKCAKEVIMYLLMTAWERIKNHPILDKDNNPWEYYTQLLHNYFDDPKSSNYRNWFYSEWNQLLEEFRNQDSKQIIDRSLSQNFTKLCGMLAADLHHKTARQNAKRRRFRCANTAVPLLWIDCDSKEMVYTSNHLEKYQRSCTLKKQSDFHDKKVSASQHSHVCKNTCWKDWCAEANFLSKAKDNEFLSPASSIIIFDYDELDYWSCVNCDLKFRKAWVPLYMVLSQPWRVYINPSAPNYHDVIKEIQETVWEKVQWQLDLN